MNAPLPMAASAEFLADVPESMKQARRWLVWKLVPQREGKPKKVPYYASGVARNGKLDTPDDIAQLSTFDTALDALQAGQYTGLGFALGPDGTGNHWQGVDLDELSKRPELVAIVDDLPGYTETSPSGNGYHAIGYGADFQSLSSNASGIEAYAHGRFFTVTGENAGIGEPCDLSGFVARVLMPKHKAASTRSEPPEAAPAVIVDTDTLRDLRSALTALRADERDMWIKIGLALKTLGEPGRSLWLEWSQTSDKWQPADARQWNTFHPSEISYQSVFAEAQRAGWLNPMSNAGRVPRPPEPIKEPAKLAPYPDPFRGPMAALHAQIMLSAPKPQPELSTLACLIGMAGAIPGIYHLEDGTRCNLYGLGVSLSGAGKDAPQWGAREIVASSGGKIIGQPASGEGLEDALESRRGMLCVLDEVAHIIAALNHDKAAPHMLSMARNLLTLYSAGKGRYCKRQRAAEKKGRGGAEQAEVIMYPCFSLLGFATPEKLGNAATAANVEDGLLGRMLFAFGHDNPEHVRARHQFEIPPHVESTAIQISNARLLVDDDAGGNLEAHVNPQIEVRTDRDADKFLDEVLGSFSRETSEAIDEPLRRTLCVRSFEKVYRVSAVLAVWDNPPAPLILHEHVAWALHLVKASNDAARRFLQEYMHGGAVQAHAAEIMRALERIRRGDLKTRRASGLQENVQVQHSALLHAVSKKMNAQEFGIAVTHLMEMDELERIEANSRGKRVFLYQ